MRYLFDTNHAIALLNGAPRLAPRLTSSRAAGDTFALSTTILGELAYGAYASQRISENRAKLASFAAQLDLFEFDATAADEFGRIKAEQRIQGKPLPTADAQIAAVASLHGLTLLTNDAHFQLIDWLNVDNWLA